MKRVCDIMMMGDSRMGVMCAVSLQMGACQNILVDTSFKT